MRSFLIALVLCLPAAAQTRFIWPLRAVSAYREVPDCYSINNFVDQNSAGIPQDWNCQSRTYSGHLGIDMDLWPFHWSMMDNNYIAVVAAAPGTVVAVVQNQNNENNCGPAPHPNDTWNYIAIRHADNSTSIYGHIRDNSAVVTVGQTVATGDILAFVGSSGRSSNPHLHFEVNSQPVLGSQVAGLIDPYFSPGACNALNANSWWVAQKPYWEPAVVRVMTHGSRPSLPGYVGSPNASNCRGGEIKNAKAEFFANDSIYFGIALRDFLQTQSFKLTVFDPNGIPWFSKTIANATGINQEKIYYTIDEKLPSFTNPGTYRVVVEFNNTETVYFFSCYCPATQNVTNTITGYQGFKSSATIEATAKLEPGNRLLLQAGTKITFHPGFVAGNGSILTARIRDCNFSE